MKTLRTLLGLFIAVFLFTACSDDDDPVYIPSAIEYAERTTTVKVGESKEFPASLIPGDVTDLRVNYTSSDPSILTVDDKGTITGVAKGKVTLTAAIPTRPDVTATSTVYVLNPTDVLMSKISVSNVQEDGTFLVLPGKTEKLEFNIEPATATDKTSLTYISSNEAIFTVDAQGVVTGVKEGSAKLTIQSEDGSNLTTEVTVNVSMGVPEDIDRSNWKIIHASSVRESDLGEGTDYTTAMFDGNYQSWWHSDWNPPADAFPIFIVIDLGQEYTDLFEFKLARRITTDNRDPNNVELYTGTQEFNVDRPNDAYDFKLATTYAFGPKDSGTDEITNIIKTPVAKARYIKIVCKDSNRDGNVSFTEFSIKRYKEMGSNPNPGGNEDYVELSNTGWSVTASDEHLTDGGTAMGILENDPKTKYWHSDWSVGAPVPHWLLVDMKKVESVARIELIHRQKPVTRGGDDYAPLIETKLGKVYLSSKNESGVGEGDASFTQVASFTDNDLASSTSSLDNPESEVITLGTPQNARYIKYVIEEVVQDNGAAHLGAIKVYTLE